MAADNGIFVQVETQLSEFGLRPLSIAQEKGLDTVFLTNNPERYADLAGYSQILRKPGNEIVTADTNSVDGVRDAVEALSRAGTVRALLSELGHVGLLTPVLDAIRCQIATIQTSTR